MSQWISPPELRALESALQAAAAMRGATAPNPPVGAAALDAQGNLLGTAAHEKAGTPHAEAGLLTQLEAQGLLGRAQTLLVTLEPCNHTGRTPPCTEAILRAKIRRVIYAVADPNPRVAGGGALALRERGVDTWALQDLQASDLTLREQQNQLLQEAQQLIAPFRKWSITGLPYVTIKRALTAQGSMIPPLGTKTFTRETSLDLAHQLRRRADAVLTGSGTVLADEPEFTVRRVPDHPGKQRKLVILDRRGRVPESYREVAQNRGFEVWMRVDLQAALAELGKAGCLEVLVEAGPTLSDSVLESGHWDESIRIQSFSDRDEVTVDLPDHRRERP
jgi:diaminohydroxyphosphoribosylaminopyrimidine deaminase/5-amino-6-(5-phosphoribosylamino)uracil reductase